MSQMSGRHCPTCGVSLSADQRFCTNCGTVLESQQQPPSYYGAQPPSQSYPYPPQAPPYPQQQQQLPSYAQSPQQPVPPYMQQAPQKQSPIAEAFGALGLLFLLRGFGGRRYAGYRPQRQRSSCCGCLVLLVVLFLCLGVPSLYYASKTSYSSFSKGLNFSSSSSSSTNSSDNSSGSITTPPPITTAQINQTVTYAGVNITIESAQQSTAFIDDTSTTTNGMIRVKIHETNTSGQNAGYFYSDVAHLILPDKNTVAPSNELHGSGPDNGNSDENWLDFAVPTSAKIAQLTLVFGSSQDAQISIPLTGKADLKVFQAKTVNLNSPINYQSLNYTLQSATQAWSIAGKQASAGMRYIVLTFKVDNHTSNNTAIGLTNDYMRLKAGGATTSPVDTTLPLYVNANTSGATGTVTFLMPENNTTYNLIFLAVQGYSTVQVNTDFNIQ